MIDIEIRRKQKREAQARYRKSVKGSVKIKEYRISDASKATNRKWYLENRYKVAAHALVRRAIDAGRLVRKPCEICNAENTHSHHDDYGKPLDVRWLCPLHHKKIHRKRWVH
jgi:hypothetical protein